MVIYPAIDLRNGRVVRLRQGRADAETVYGDEPAEIAARWQSKGAQWLHVVNLDGAFGEDTAANSSALEMILQIVSIPVQFGGGLRDLASMEAAFARGVARIVMGTAALQSPSLVSQALERWGAERVAVGIDARDGIVATHGWQTQSTVPALELARQMRARGVLRVIYTDIARDGMLGGVDAVAVAELAKTARVSVIASGGVASIADVQALAARTKDGIEGVIVGQALYTGGVELEEAIQAASRPLGRSGDGSEAPHASDRKS
jgi:phosphoribosylformimino-5-aminoimidazole carboxamide ribotide isomerase